MEKVKHLINGELVEGAGEILKVYNPTTGEVLDEIKQVSKEQSQQALIAAKDAFEIWSKTSLTERENYIEKLIGLLARDRDFIIELLINETGKAQSIAEYDFDMIPSCLRFFIEEAKRLNGTIIPDYTNEHLSMTIRKPVGVVVGYLAWNFPLLNIGYKIGPALASGCTAILKPSSMTPLATLYIGKLIIEAGFPKGVVNIIAGSGAEVSEVLNRSDIPKMLTLIGSSYTGRKIVEQSASSVKHMSLELGGNAPVVVFKDADVVDAANCTADGKFGNSGQVCVAPNRVFVHEAVKDEFIENVKKFAQKIVLGCGKTEGEFIMGPVVSEKALNYMLELIEDAKSKGAVVITGGKRAERAGYFLEPTILANVNSNMKVYQEEIFGPIMPILTFNDTDDIVKLANDTIYGLASYVYTKDLCTALKMATEIDAGNVCINEPFYNYNLPHGGCKESGIGKDCSTYSLEEYYYIQRITIKK